MQTTAKLSSQNTTSRAALESELREAKAYEFTIWWRTTAFLASLIASSLWWI